ncbi:hypothetical protein GOEFS_132_00690 [Gordonia effusa NBRC 100432]|uniref:SWIM-type domain-containing protein n=1 Tax=Gordonia effusa NBRC 100432 TaxID=1077974 RepID=H0R6Y7_9ACTN|nr:hypothetical protein [Gordonia effusa]GAB20838.1 hypothetical protein GOEFS_132_00690 [Gordonia effusa NBRC 100432]
MATKRQPPIRAYGVTEWSRAFLSVIDQSQHRRVTKARSYFRERHVHRLSIGKGIVGATVDGSQLTPFETTLRTRTVDAATVVDLLRQRDALDDLMAVARGEQPTILRELVAPTEAADVVAACTCPIDDTCIHVLAVAFEVAAEIDRRSSTLLTVMGADLADLLARQTDRGESTGAESTTPLQITDYFGDNQPLPNLPAPPSFRVFTEFDASALRAALRASGVGALDVAEATDELTELYEHITDGD